MITSRLPLYTDISGNEIGVTLYEYGRGENGLYIQGGVHGGEVTYFIFEKLHEWLIAHEKELPIKVALAPIINPSAWNQRIYYYTAGKFDLYKGRDWNRSYPGAETTLSARNSRIIFQKASQYRFAVDLHTARWSKPYTIFADQKLSPYLRAMSIPYNYFMPTGNQYAGAFDDALLAAGVNALTVECGSHDMYEPENIEIVTAALQRLISYVQGISVDTRHLSPCKITKLNTLYSPVSGFIRFLTEPQQDVKKGQILARISKSTGLGVIHEIVAPSDGLVFELSRSAICWTGDELLRFANKKDIVPL